MSDSEKPGSALEAVEAAAAEPEPSDSSSDIESSAEDTQEQPQLEASTDTAPTEQSDEGPAPQEASQGPIPFDRHKSALENARKKEREAAQAELREQLEGEYKQRYGWADGYQQSDVEAAVSRYQQLMQNPVDFYRALGREIEAHPHLGPQLQQPQEFKLPEPALRSEDGKLVYSAEQQQQIWEHREQTLRAEYAQQLQQIQQRIDQQQQLEQQRQAVAAAQATSQSIVAALEQLEGWEQVKPAIEDGFRKLSNDQITQMGGVKATVLELYANELPKILKKVAKKEARDSIQKKAAAGTVDPGSVSADAAARPKNQKDLEKWLKSQAGAA